MNEYRYLIRVVWFFLAAALLVVCLTLYVDPFQVYHKPFLPGMQLNENQRYQNAGLINSWLADPEQGYDSVAFGASMSANFTGADLAAALHWKKTVRLFVNGASPAEMKETVTKALATGKVKHLLLEADIWTMKGAYESADNPTFPRYLYNESKLDDVKYFVDQVVFLEAVKLAFGLKATEHGTPDMLGYWADRDWVGELHARLNDRAFIRSLDITQEPLSPRSEKKITSFHYPALQNELAPVIKQLCNSDIEVVLFVPPFSALNYRQSKTIIYPVIYEVRYILKMIEGCQNIRLHAFDLMDFTADLNNYKDRRHYLPHVNAQMLRWIHNREHILSLDMIEAYEATWINKLNTRKICSSYPGPLKMDL
jgi:hypothetical protein